MLQELMAVVEFVERKIKRLEKAIAPQRDMEILTRSLTILGADMMTAWTILAQLGCDMGVLTDPSIPPAGRLLFI